LGMNCRAAGVNDQDLGGVLGRSSHPCRITMRSLGTRSPNQKKAAVQQPADRGKKKKASVTLQKRTAWNECQGKDDFLTWKMVAASLRPGLCQNHAMDLATKTSWIRGRLWRWFFATQGCQQGRWRPKQGKERRAKITARKRNRKSFNEGLWGAASVNDPWARNFNLTLLAEVTPWGIWSKLLRWRTKKRRRRASRGGPWGLFGCAPSQGGFRNDAHQ